MNTINQYVKPIGTVLSLSFFFAHHRAYVSLLSITLSTISFFVNSQEYSEYDEKAGLYFIQSKTYPMIFKKCGKLFPELKDAFEIGLEKWNVTNDAIIKHGKLLSQADIGLDGKEFKIYMDNLVKSLSNDMKKQSKKDLKDGCGDALVYLITES